MEMMLHHLITLFLCAFSYMLNMTLVGAIVMFLHDIADIPTQFVRCFSETTKFKTTICSVVGMIVTWFYTRIIVFPYCIYQFFIFYPENYQGKGFFFHLCILFVLHVYWFGLMLKAIGKFVAGGKLEEASVEKHKIN